MKIPFFYGSKNHSFKFFLGASVLAHTVVLGAAGVFFSAPEYSVEEGPSSMEVVMIQEIEKRPEKIKEKIVEVSEEASIKIQASDKKNEEKKPEPVVSSPAKGALPQAKPDYLRNPAPVYPEIARRNGWEGVVILKALISESGNCEKVSVFKSSGRQVLDESALRAVKRWKFLPARAGNITFSSWINIPVRFVLEEKG